ncbi:MAG: copper resistance protein B [Hyphomonadaceae bacterium]
MNWRMFIAFAAPLVMAAPALAQTPAHTMEMPATPQPAPAATQQEAVDHSQMDHGATQQQDAAPAQMDHGAMDHSQMDMSSSAAEVGNEPAPDAPSDHAAERFYSAEEMDASRGQLRREHGGAIVSTVRVDLAEFQFNGDDAVFRWEGEGWIGGDINRFVFKTEGEVNDDGVERAEVQALYSRAVGPYFDLQAGVRYDVEPSPNRAYAVVGFEGVAPYWFETTGALFVSDEGEVSGRLGGSYDARLTQRLILQPRAEINFSADDIPELGIGDGVTDAELGLRLRYEIRRTFAPYVGVSYESKLGDTADYARADGEDASDTRFVIGVRTWF